MRVSRVLAGVLIFIAIGITASAADKAYPIKLKRPNKAGDRFQMTSTFSQKQVMSVSRDGTVLQDKNETDKATLVATVVIDKVDDTGEPTKKTVSIVEFVDGKKNALLKRGQVVTVETVDGKPEYQLKDGTFDTRAKKLFASIVKTKTSTAKADDRVFGSKVPRKVGESWKINAAEAAKDLQVKAEAIQGAVKLVGVETKGGQECLRIAVSATIKDFPNSEMMKKQGYELKNPVFAIKLGGLFPTDLTADSIERSQSMAMKAEMNGTKGAVKGFAIKMSMEMSLQTTIKPQ